MTNEHDAPREAQDELQRRNARKKRDQPSRRRRGGTDSVWLLKRRDERDWERLVRDIKPRMVALLRFLTGCSRETAEDAVQEALLALWERIDGLDDSRPAGPYVATVAINYVRRSFNRARHENVLHLRGVAQVVQEEEFSGRSDEKLLVLEAVKTLPESQQIAVLLIKGMRWTAREAAIALSALEGEEVSDDSAEGRARRGLTGLKKYFGRSR